MKYWVMHLFRDIEPVVYGSFSSKVFQTAKAKELYKKYSGDRIYWIKEDEDDFLTMGLYRTSDLQGK